MRIANVLHPEIILDRRGDLVLKKFYKTYLPRINSTPQGFAVDYDIQQMDNNLRDHLLMTYKFKHNGGRTYYCGKDFIQALSKIDKEIPVEFMPKRFLGYLAFPENVVFDGEEEIQGAYAFVGDGKETSLKQEDWGKQVVWISYVGKESNSVCRLCAELTKEKVSALANKYDTADYYMPPTLKGSVPGTRELVYRLIINLILYTNSADPDLMNLKSMALSSKTQRNKAESSGQIVNECTLPLTLLSWNYRQERNYQVDNTWVETHPRWQRCGVGFTQIKLIWVKAHERKYNKTNESDTGAFL